MTILPFIMTFNFFPRDQLLLFALLLKRWLIYKDWLKMQMIFFWPFYPWKNKIITYVTMLPAEVFGLLHHPLGHRISIALHSQHYIGRKQMHWKNKHNYQTALTLLLTKIAHKQHENLPPMPAVPSRPE